MSHPFMAPKEDSSKQISLRPVSANDNEFLLHVYAGTRQDEMASWGWSAAQQAGFVRMQFDARQRTYAAAYPSAEGSLISMGDVPVGSIIVSRGSCEIRLVDIALLPEYRNHGIGTDLIAMLIAESTRSKAPLRLSVLRVNPATHLYERLGFVTKGSDAMYCEMEHAPSQIDASLLNPAPENGPHAGKSE